MSTVEQMEGQIAELRRQITIQRDQNAARNRLLDLLGMCWCDGGCTKGMHRFYEGEPTAADIAALQVNAARARAWFVNRAFRLADHHPTAARIAHAAIDAAMPPGVPHAPARRSRHDKADAELARSRWWSGEAGLLLPWYCRDHERVVGGLEPDGLWNGPTPCGGTIAGIPERFREAMEARHREDCVDGCAAAQPGSQAVVFISEVLPPSRVPQMHCRGRWRAVKRKLQALAAELGWPGCMKVASHDQVEGRVLMAGAKLSRWHKLTSKHRRPPADRRAERRHRKALRANVRDPDHVPF